MAARWFISTFVGLEWGNIVLANFIQVAAPPVYHSGGLYTAPRVAARSAASSVLKTVLRSIEQTFLRELGRVHRRRGGNHRDASTPLEWPAPAYLQQG